MREVLGHIEDALLAVCVPMEVNAREEDAAVEIGTGYGALLCALRNGERLGDVLEEEAAKAFEDAIERRRSAAGIGPDEEFSYVVPTPGIMGVHQVGVVLQALLEVEAVSATEVERFLVRRQAAVRWAQTSRRRRRSRDEDEPPGLLDERLGSLLEPVPADRRGAAVVVLAELGLVGRDAHLAHAGPVYSRWEIEQDPGPPRQILPGNGRRHDGVLVHACEICDRGVVLHVDAGYGLSDNFRLVDDVGTSYDGVIEGDEPEVSAWVFTPAPPPAARLWLCSDARWDSFAGATGWTGSTRSNRTLAR